MRPLPKISSLFSSPFSFPPFLVSQVAVVGARKSQASKRQRTMSQKGSRVLLSDVTPIAHICYVPCICSALLSRRVGALIELKIENILIIAGDERAGLPNSPLNAFTHWTVCSRCAYTDSKYVHTQILCEHTPAWVDTGKQCTHNRIHMNIL